MKNSKAMWISLSVIGGIAIVALMVVGAVATLRILDGESNTARTPDGGDATGPTMAIEDTPVTLSGGVVTSACFTFDMPVALDFEINPNSAGCQTAIRVGTDNLLAITVGAQSGSADLDDFFASIEEAAGGTDATSFSTDTVMISGVASGVAYFENGYGLPQAFYMIPAPVGAFESAGEPVTSFFISGPVGSDEVRAIVEDLAASFTITG